MPKKVRRALKTTALTSIALLALGFLLTPMLLQMAHAAPYVNPWWANNSPSQESAVEQVAQLAMVCEGKCGHGCGGGCSGCSGSRSAGSSNCSTCDTGCRFKVTVDARTGELFVDHFLFKTPGTIEDNAFGFRWRSMIAGASQLGGRILPSWEVTAQYIVINGGNPNGPGGHRVDIRRPSGRIDAFVWNGASYTAPTDVFDTLTITGGGLYLLTDKHGAAWHFSAQGTLMCVDDSNLNRDVPTYNGAFQMTGYTDERGKGYTIVHNANGYISSMADPAGRTWAMTYDMSDNLKTITSPSTPSHPTGIVTTLSYDGQNRLTSVTDGRGNTVWSFVYVGATNQISTVTINGDTVTYGYVPGVTTRTDREGNVYRYYHTGQQVTKTDMLVAGAAKYVTLYRHSAPFVSNVVLPRGNRIDFVHDSMGNLTERRHRTADTATNDPSDIVHAWTYNAGNFSTGYTDPNGNAWVYGRDGAGNLTTVTHPTVTNPATQTASRTMTYNTKGQITQLIDEEGNRTDFSYYTTTADFDLLHKIEVDPLGLDLETVLTYDTAGNVATTTDPRGNASSRTWDNLRRLTETQAPSPLSYRVKYEYDGNSNPTKVEIENIDKDGNQVTANPWITHTRTYTATDDVATMVEEIDVSTTRTTTLEYDKNQNRIRVIKPEGNKELWEFNERDWVIKHTLGETDPKASTAEYAYDENGNRTQSKDGRGNATDTTFDLFDRPTKTTNALGHYAERTYDKNGNTTKLQQKDSSNTELQRETYFFDERSRHWKTSALFQEGGTTHSDAVTVIERLKTSQVSEITDPRSNDTTHIYDAALRRTKTTDAMGNEWSFTLDANGNWTDLSIKEIDGLSSVTHDYEATYDVLNRRTTYVEVDRNTPTTKYTTTDSYDSRSNLVFRINAEGNPTRWTVDGLNRVLKRERALTVGATINDFTSAQVTEWGFDKNNRLVSHKDDGTNLSTYEWDALDRKAKLTYPDLKTCLYEYDKAHNTTKITDPAGNVVDDVFDVLNRNTSRTVTKATGFLGTTSETRTYDALNRMVTNEDDDYKLTYAYSVIGLQSYVREETQGYVGQPAWAKTVSKTYDANGNRTGETYPTGSGLSLTYAYNVIDHMTSISDGTNTLASYSHIGVRDKGTTYGNGATRSNAYSGFRNELSGVHHQTSAPATIVRLEYGYNKVHDRTYERFGASGASGDAFVYDKLRRLTNAYMGSSTPSNPVGNAYVEKIDFNMDDDGNRSSVVTTPFGVTPTTVSYTTNNLYEYTSVGGTTHTWDANGNLTANGTYKFEYNYKNLIVKVRKQSNNSLVAEYKYDAEGRRVEKDVGGTTERFVLSGAYLIATFNGSDSWIRNFVTADDGAVVVLEQSDVLDFDMDGNTMEITRSYYHRGASGYVVTVTDANEATVADYRHEPYGVTTITRQGQILSADPLGQPWAFDGMFRDEETGLLYDGSRYYSPVVGRYLQRDPLAHNQVGAGRRGLATTHGQGRPGAALNARIKIKKFDIGIVFPARSWCVCITIDIEIESTVNLGKQVQVTKSERLGMKFEALQNVGRSPIFLEPFPMGRKYKIKYTIYQVSRVTTVKIKGRLCIGFNCPQSFLDVTTTTKEVKTKVGERTATFSVRHSRRGVGRVPIPIPREHVEQNYGLRQREAIQEQEGEFSYVPTPPSGSFTQAPPIDYGPGGSGR